MKRLCVYALVLALLLSLAACGTSDIPESTTATAPSDSLSALRADIKPPLMAVAEFGFPELSESFGIMDYLMDEYPKWMQSHDFIGKIPQERTVRACSDEGWYELICIVPRDPAATVCVNITHYMEDYPYEELDTEVVYRSESGEPILLLADISDLNVVSVTVTDSEGRGVLWQPYWGSSVAVPDDGYWGHLVMDFSPVSEKSAYDIALDNGWTAPDDSFLTDHFWCSDYGYKLELRYSPSKISDGEAYIHEPDMNGIDMPSYEGHWQYADGVLHLSMKNIESDSYLIDDGFPVLTDPYGEGWVSIFRTDAGIGLPHFEDYMDNDELYPVSLWEDPYNFALSQGWTAPELWELLGTSWLSENGYAIDLMDDSVPGNNGGWVTVYDVGEYGNYTPSYTGSWEYEDGMLYLSLFPEFEDGYLVDDSFPVLILDGELWIGRNSDGFGLPHFQWDQNADVLDQPMG